MFSPFVCYCFNILALRFSASDDDDCFYSAVHTKSVAFLSSIPLSGRWVQKALNCLNWQTFCFYSLVCSLSLNCQASKPYIYSFGHCVRTIERLSRAISILSAAHFHHRTQFHNSRLCGHHWAVQFAISAKSSTISLCPLCVVKKAGR